MKGFTFWFSLIGFILSALFIFFIDEPGFPVSFTLLVPALVVYGVMLFSHTDSKGD